MHSITQHLLKPSTCAYDKVDIPRILFQSSHLDIRHGKRGNKATSSRCRSGQYCLSIWGCCRPKSQSRSSPPGNVTSRPYHRGSEGNIPGCVILISFASDSKRSALRLSFRAFCFVLAFWRRLPLSCRQSHVLSASKSACDCLYFEVCRKYIRSPIKTNTQMKISTPIANSIPMLIEWLCMRSVVPLGYPTLFSIGRCWSI